jgi:hypothetical protein
MDPITVAAVLTAVVTGVSETLGGQLWAGVVALVRRPLRGRKGLAGELPTAGLGEAELTALQGAPGDRQKAVALAETLLARASADAEFQQALHQWWEQAAPVREKIGDATNSISGGTFNGPVLQGRDFSNLTFQAAPAPAPAPRQGDPSGR